MGIGKYTEIPVQLDFMLGKAEVAYQAQLGPGFRCDIRSLPHPLFLVSALFCLPQHAQASCSLEMYVACMM